MSHSQILHLDGHRFVANNQVTISGENCQGCTWNIHVLDDGSLCVQREGGARLSLNPVNPTTIFITKRD